jgi:murein DD-endopeptidase MepM/ murein hydrolase activator NlpD
MRTTVASSRAKVVSHLSVVALISVGIAGCADSGRFGDPSFSLNGGAPEMTSAIPPAQTAPVARVETQPLGGTQVSCNYNPPPAYTPPAANNQPAAYNPPPQRYNPPAQRYSAPPAYQPVPARVSAAQPAAPTHVAAKPAEKPKKVADAKPTQRDLAPKNLGTLHSSTPPEKTAAAPAPAAAKPTRVASLGPVATARVASASDDAANDVKAGQTNVAAASATPSFRWPVRGRVIAGFGPKTTGQQNDGINLAVPEGTSVKAAEDGVVAYAGNELKGYGNLVLIRHSNGYVTAYAHASSIKVKRGDTVKRGQIIALAGQTGSVSSPQLHFEIRKGSSPVDPMPLLN